MPDNFLLLCCHAMTFLKKNQRTNVLYNLAKGLGTRESVKAEIFNPAIGEELLREILLRQLEGCSISDIVNCLRKRTVPNGYSYHTWREGILHNNNYCSM